MSDWNPKANEIFLAALEIEDRAARAEFISDRCAGDDALRQAVEALLADAAKAGSFLEQPAMDNPAHAFESPTLSPAANPIHGGEAHRPIPSEQYLKTKNRRVREARSSAPTNCSNASAKEAWVMFGWRNRNDPFAAASH
jgi:hypothetical protein